MNIKITNIGIPLLDSIVNFLPISLMLTVIAISGLANAYNIIDGNNGLASMLAILTLSGLVVIAYNHSDHEIILLCLAMIGCLFGFFLINFPRGLIFMGDSGAYFTGFIVAIITVSLIQRNESISPWVGLLINALPVTETVFSGFRRKFILGNSPSLADNLHLHSLVFRKLVQSKKSFLLSVHSNPKTSFFIWLFSCLSIIPAVIFQVNTFMLIVTSIFFILLFIWLYKRLLKSST
jgi:UDP-N-acetylmuramyl pentapeptide phosphotransferase/UDP-N-acetylglucosamine-1-phosphate transferase